MRKSSFVIPFILLIPSLSFANTGPRYNPDFGFYAGAQLGNEFHSGCDSCCDIHDKKHGLVERGFAGIDFNRYFGVELGLTSYPNHTFSWGDSVVEGKFSHYSVDLLAKATLPIYKNLSLVARAGASDNRFKGNAVVRYSCIDPNNSNRVINSCEKQSFHDHQVRPMGGVGLSYAISRNISADANYLNSVDCSKGFYTFGLTFKFK